MLFLANFISYRKSITGHELIYFSTIVHYFRIVQASASISLPKIRLVEDVNTLLAYYPVFKKELPYMASSLLRFMIYDKQIPVSSEVIDYLII